MNDISLKRASDVGALNMCKLYRKELADFYRQRRIHTADDDIVEFWSVPQRSDKSRELLAKEHPGYEGILEFLYEPKEDK